MSVNKLTDHCTCKCVKQPEKCVFDSEKQSNPVLCLQCALRVLIKQHTKLFMSFGLVWSDSSSHRLLSNHEDSVQTFRITPDMTLHWDYTDTHSDAHVDSQSS